MFAADSVVFVSRENFEVGNHPVSGIGTGEGNRPPYALSYHSGFRTFDYSPIEEVRNCRQTSRALRIAFESPAGKRWTAVVDADHRIFTRNRGFVEAGRTAVMDVFIDCEGSLCKIVEKENLGISERDMSELSVSFNHSAFINGILMKA